MDNCEHNTQEPQREWTVGHNKICPVDGAAVSGIVHYAKIYNEYKELNMCIHI